jgi:hypothetical protein
MPSDLDDALKSFLEPYAFKYDVFISYSGADEKEAKALYQALRPDLVSFYAPESLSVESQNEILVEPIQHGLMQSCQMVALLSESYLARSWCALELRGFFNLVAEEGRRKLWIVPLEPVDEELPGQMTPFLFSGTRDTLVESIRTAAASLKIHVGDRFKRQRFPRMFVELPLREYYPPPHTRAPWGNDSQSRGMPGAPLYDSYERLVREYMVQLLRGRKPDRLEVAWADALGPYAYFTEDARRDAKRLIDLGVSPYQRPYHRTLGDWLRELRVAREQGQDPAEMNRLEGVARAHAGQLEEGIRLLRDNLTGADTNYYGGDWWIHAELAQALYLSRRYEEALEVLSVLDKPLVEFAELVHAACLARLCRLTEAERQANAEKNVFVNDIRIQSELERRVDLDFFAEGLELAGYRQCSR